MRRRLPAKCRKPAERNVDFFIDEYTLAAQPLGMEDLYAVARASCGSAEPRAWLMERLVEAERMGLVARYPDGRWGPAG